MFSKLLKYDFRSVKRFGLPILLAVAIATVLGSAAIGGIFGTFYGVASVGLAASLVRILLVLIMLAVVLVLTLAVSGTYIAVYVDFYKSLISDEGYLTFTLPVKPRKILLSKLVNALLWGLIVGAAVLAAACIIIFVAAVSAGNTLEPTPSVPSVPAIPEAITTPDGMIALLIQMPFFAIAASVNSILLVFMAIFFGSVLAKKHKLIAAIGCVFGVNMLYSFFGQIFSLFLSIPVVFVEKPLVYTNIYIAISTVLLIVLSVVFFKLTEHMMEKKLNLP